MGTLTSLGDQRQSFSYHLIASVHILLLWVAHTLLIFFFFFSFHVATCLLNQCISLE